MKLLPHVGRVERSKRHVWRSCHCHSSPDKRYTAAIASVTPSTLFYLGDTFLVSIFWLLKSLYPTVVSKVVVSLQKCEGQNTLVGLLSYNADNGGDRPKEKVRYSRRFAALIILERIFIDQRKVKDQSKEKCLILSLSLRIKFCLDLWIFCVQWNTKTLCQTFLLTQNFSPIPSTHKGKQSWKFLPHMFRKGLYWFYFCFCLCISIRFIQYNPTSLERNHKHELLTEVDLGVPIDLILPETYTTSDPGGMRGSIVKVWTSNEKQ